jgi:arginyl-tRNA--protein-N-Asp/Glu arginylyltransferase
MDYKRRFLPQEHLLAQGWASPEPPMEGCEED